MLSLVVGIHFDGFELCLYDTCSPSKSTCNERLLLPRALIIRIGFRGIVYHIDNKEPTKIVLVIILASTLLYQPKLIAPCTSSPSSAQLSTRCKDGSVCTGDRARSPRRASCGNLGFGS